MTQPNEGATILIVDADANVRGALAAFLGAKGYVPETAASTDEALTLLHRIDISCMLVDVDAPGVSALDFVIRALAVEPRVAILILAGVEGSTSAALCMQRGAMDYVSKPVDLTVLEHTIRRALSRRRTLMDKREAHHWLTEEVALRSAELRLERENIERISVATLEALVNALEARDPYLRGHSARVADLSATVASELGANDEEVERIRTAGRLHDIGKIGIRDEVVNKRGPLSDSEYEHVKQHVLVGSQILGPLVHLEGVIACVRSHHERWDGSGYPDRLAGEAIPFGARVIGAAEVFDALTTTRPYQERMGPAAAVARRRDLAGTTIDPAVYAALEKVVSQRSALTFVDEGRP